jgi:DNA-binding transcriptional MocR family regulator
LRAIRATVYAPAAFSGLIFARWVEDGSALRITETVRTEVEARAVIAKEVLGAPWSQQVGQAPHIWLPLSELEAERVAGRAQREGVAVTPPGGPIVNGRLISGLRVCLGGVATTADLVTGLERLRAALSPTVSSAAQSMV